MPPPPVVTCVCVGEDWDAGDEGGEHPGAAAQVQARPHAHANLQQEKGSIYIFLGYWLLLDSYPALMPMQTYSNTRLCFPFDQLLINAR